MNTEAQLTAPRGQNKLAGEYYLQGVMETASGFKLDPDSTFQFFFSYGALDRYGKGTWTMKNKGVVFNSRKHPGKDFRLISSKKIDNDSVTIKIIDSNGIFLSHLYCRMGSGEKKWEQISDKEGLIRFPKYAVDSLSLIFEFCPERTSVFTISDPTHNYFEFGFEPWIMEVFFSNFRLNIEAHDLKGPHPLLTGTSYNFIKNKR